MDNLQGPILQLILKCMMTFVHYFQFKILLSNLLKTKTFFNVDGGRCDECKGEGTIKIEMQFMSDIVLTCESCKGKRFKKKF